MDSLLNNQEIKINKNILKGVGGWGLGGGHQMRLISKCKESLSRMYSNKYYGQINLQQNFLKA
jgi:hypothetical protein